MLPNIRNILFAAGLGHDTRYVLEYALSQAQKLKIVNHRHQVQRVSIVDMLIN